MNCSTAKHKSSDQDSYPCPQGHLPHALTNWSISPPSRLMIGELFEFYVTAISNVISGTHMKYAFAWPLRDHCSMRYFSIGTCRDWERKRMAFYQVYGACSLATFREVYGIYGIVNALQETHCGQNERKRMLQTSRKRHAYALRRQFRINFGVLLKTS